MAAQKRALTRNPDLLWPHACMAACAVSLGLDEEAQAEFAEARRLNPQFSWEVYYERSPFKGELPESEKRMREGLRRLGLM